MHTAGSRVVLGKNYWDVAHDLELMNNAVAMNLLYIQAVAEVERGWIIVADALKDRLNTLQDHGKKKEVCFSVYYNLETEVDSSLNEF